jgi:hypothetical protein
MSDLLLKIGKFVKLQICEFTDLRHISLHIEQPIYRHAGVVAAKRGIDGRQGLTGRRGGGGWGNEHDLVVDAPVPVVRSGLAG